MRILIVDDNANLRKLVRLTLEGLGHELEELDSGVATLRRALETRPDVVVLDVMMPGVNSYEICYLIKTTPLLRHTQVVLLTARGQAADVETGRSAHADAYLVKPFDPGALLETVERLRAGENALFPAPRVAARPARTE